MIRVGIADDEDLVRDGIAALLSSLAGIIVVATASTAVEAIELADSGSIDILLLDIHLGGRGGIDALREIVHRASARRGDPVGVIMVSGLSQDEYGVRSIRSGAAAFVPKASNPAMLAEAIRTVASGRRYLTPRIAELLADFAEHGPENAHQQLSHREYEVFELLAAGRSVTEVSEQLSLAVSTVSTYRARILEKLGVESTAAVIRYAAQRGLV